MADYHCFIYSPGGNITALVETDVPLDFPAVALGVMSKYPEVEQVGFIMPGRLAKTDFHLQMMGGEFCGNASRCAALHWALANKKPSVVFTVSGFVVPLSAQVNGETVTTRIPGEFLRSFKTVSGGWLADFYGIKFFVTEKNLTKAEINTAIDKYRGEMDAMGVVILNISARGYSIAPSVWVKSTNTFIAETACASGSIAASLALRDLGLSLPSFSIIQPSSSALSVGVESQFLDFTLSGVVKKMSQDTLAAL